MSIRAQKILDYLKNLTLNPIWIRQQTLAEEFKCSRRTIGRCLKELKEAGLLTDLNKRHDNRCKMYLVSPSLLGGEGAARSVAGEVLTPAAQHQLRLYGRTFSGLFKMYDGCSGRPTFEDSFAEVAGKLKHVTDETELYTKIFEGFRALPNLKETAISWRNEPENQNKGGTAFWLG
ncbi:MAG: helix-turn-helix domain-containing protein [Myxococcaceae bacterium]